MIFLLFSKFFAYPSERGWRLEKIHGESRKNPGGGSVGSAARAMEFGAYCAGLKLSFRLTLRLKTRWPSWLSLLSRQK